MPTPPEILVSFLRKLPNNKACIQTIPRPNRIGVEALRFLACGGWYLSEKLASGGVRLSATDSELRELTSLECANDATLVDHVDLLIQRSQSFLGLLVSQQESISPKSKLLSAHAVTQPWAN